MLPNLLYNGPQNSNIQCQALCRDKGYAFQGSEYLSECYCGDRPPPPSAQAEDSRCTYPCSGNPADQCGGSGDYISVYYDPNKYNPAATPKTVQKAGKYNFVGCYSEVPGRALRDQMPVAPATGFSIRTCQKACQGYTYFGLEYGQECFCSNSIASCSAKQLNSDPAINGCSMSCAGNATQYCGGSNRIQLYQHMNRAPAFSSCEPETASRPTYQQTSGHYRYIGCFTDNTQRRTLKAKVTASRSNTVDQCAAACVGYQYFGTEYGSECYCDSGIGASSTFAPGGADATLNGCSIPCDGDASTYCGGSDRLTIYSLTVPAVVAVANATTISNLTVTPPTVANNSTVVVNLTVIDRLRL